MTPQIRCTACGESFFERSDVGLMGACPECGADDEGVLILDIDEGEVPEAPVLIRDPLDEARKAAAALLAEASITAPPVPVVNIAEDLGLKVEPRPLGELSGRLEEDVIVVNSNHHPVRQRFTVAHELGHHRLHTSHDSTGGDIERQADAFAAALLMPPQMLWSAVESDPDFDRLRGLFEVSRPALTIALRNARLSSHITGV
jgi:hypothetical protein